METRRSKPLVLETRPSKRSRREEIVHSGQFMRSNVHEEAADDEVHAWSALESGENGSHFQLKRISNENDLLLLVTRIANTYSSGFTSPKWLNFKGVGIQWRDKIRMNNVIWRDWHSQYTSRQRPSFCRFAYPFDDPVHCKPLAVVLEGKYWRRKLDAVVSEYTEWRVYWQARQQWKWTQRQDDKASETSTPSCTIDSQGCSTSNSEDSPSFTNQGDPWITSQVQNLLQPGPLRQRGHPYGSASLGATSEQDNYGIGLIEEFLRNGEKSSGDDCLPTGGGGPQWSLQDAMEVLAEVAHQHKEPTRPPMLAVTVKQPLMGVNEQPIAADAMLCQPKQEVSLLFEMPFDYSHANNVTGFSVLGKMVSSLCSNNSRKLSKSTILQCTAEHCKSVRKENEQIDDQISLLKLQIELLKREALGVHNQIPNKETLHDNFRREMFDAWVRARTWHNCKFSLFALLLVPLYRSFMSSLSTKSPNDVRCTMLVWLHTSCTLANLRQTALSSLNVLSKSTSMLTSPERLPAELRERAKRSWLPDAELGPL